MDTGNKNGDSEVDSWEMRASEYRVGASRPSELYPTIHPFMEDFDQVATEGPAQVWSIDSTISERFR